MFYNSAASELLIVCLVNKLVNQIKIIKSQMLLKYCTCIYYWRIAIESVTELTLGVMSVNTTLIWKPVICLLAVVNL